MIRILIFLILLFALAGLGAFIADEPGQISVDWLGYDIRVKPILAFVLLLATLFAAIFLWSLLRFLFGAPKLISGYFLRRRHDRGYRALADGMIAIGAGDAKRAKKLSVEASRLLTSEPATLLLAAQTAQLTGDKEGALKAFENLIEEPTTRTLGFHGLFIEAERRGDDDAALKAAGEAVLIEPALHWALDAMMRYHAKGRQWRDALSALDLLFKAKHVDKAEDKKLRAILLTADAGAEEDRNPDYARGVAQKAHALDPGLVPAALVAARLFVRGGDLRKASKTLEENWKIAPHPDIAELYLNLRSGDSARDKLKRAKSLVALHVNHEESSILLARAAFAMQDWALARESLVPLFEQRPSERVYVLMAEIEESETGHLGRAREWLSRALRAPRDAGWMADGILRDEWDAITPQHGILGGFEWKQPPDDMMMIAHDQATENLDHLLIPPPLVIEEKVSEPLVENVTQELQAPEDPVQADIEDKAEAIESHSTGEVQSPFDGQPDDPGLPVTAPKAKAPDYTTS